jgi:hypothetical protein
LWEAVAEAAAVINKLLAQQPLAVAVGAVLAC